MANIMNLIPELTGEELTSVGELVKDMSDDQAGTFASAYRAQAAYRATAERPEHRSVVNDPWFIVVAGVQRFYVGQIGMGLLFLFTGGFCLIGTIIDVIDHKKLATQYNLGVASELAMLVKGIVPSTRLSKGSALVSRSSWRKACCWRDR